MPKKVNNQIYCLPAGARHSQTQPMTLNKNEQNQTKITSEPRNTQAECKGSASSPKGSASSPKPKGTYTPVIRPERRIVLENYPFEINEHVVLNFEQEENPSSEINKVVLNKTEVMKAQEAGNNAHHDVKPITIEKSEKSDTIAKYESTGAVPKNLQQNTETSKPTQPKGIRAKLLEKKKQKEAQMKIDELNKINVQEQPKEIVSIVKKCNCKDCDDFIKCPSWRNNNVTFDDSGSSRKGVPLFKQNILQEQTLIMKKIDNKILIHGPVIPKAIFSLNETYFDDAIQKALQTLNITSVTNIQSYMWPSILRGLSAFMIAPPKSGKTLSYLPAFCCFCDERNERYSGLTKYEGPLVVILCVDNEACIELQNLVKSLTSEYTTPFTVKVLSDEYTPKNSYDILITTPVTLEESLKLGTVKLKRVCHIAIDNAHVILRQYNSSIQKIFNVISAIQMNRPHNKYVQVVVSSEKWSADLETLLKKLHTAPVVCFEDFLEAAIYSKIQIKKKTLKTAIKLGYLLDILEKRYMTHKSVIFCDEDDIPKIREFLEGNGVECTVISNQLSEDDMLENEDTWNALTNGQYRVLLRTDSVFGQTVKVSNAQFLIHYSLPNDWNQFQKRFKCLSSDLTSPLDAQENDVFELQTKCNYIVIDEFCNNQLFLDFLESWSRSLIQYLKL